MSTLLVMTDNIFVQPNSVFASIPYTMPRKDFQRVCAVSDNFYHAESRNGVQFVDGTTVSESDLVSSPLFYSSIQNAKDREDIWLGLQMEAYDTISSAVRYSPYYTRNGNDDTRNFGVITYEFSSRGPSLSGYRYCDVASFKLVEHYYDKLLNVGANYNITKIAVYNEHFIIYMTQDDQKIAIMSLEYIKSSKNPGFILR